MTRILLELLSLREAISEMKQCQLCAEGTRMACSMPMREMTRVR